MNGRVGQFLLLGKLVDFSSCSKLCGPVLFLINRFSLVSTDGYLVTFLFLKAKVRAIFKTQNYFIPYGIHLK